MQREGAELDPAVRVVRIMHGEGGEQQCHGDGDGRKDHVRPIEMTVVDAHQHRHGDEAERGPACFAEQEEVGRVVALAGHDRRGAEHHRQSNEDQQQHDTVEPFVDADAFGHCLLPFRRELPGEYKFLEDAATMLIAVELVKAGAGRREQDDVSGYGGGSCLLDGGL